MSLHGKTILITGAAKRIGRALALSAAVEGADVIIHYGFSEQAARRTQADIQSLGRIAYLLQADLEQPDKTMNLIEQANAIHPLFALVNNAAIFEFYDLETTSLEAWQRHISINLTAPFLLSQAFASALGSDEEGRIINILDWRALRPGSDHLPYTISKAGLAALTSSLAVALAPRISVNGIALGAVLPPIDSSDTYDIIEDIPANRWARLSEVCDTLNFLLDGPSYITGEIIHLDGGRHLI